MTRVVLDGCYPYIVPLFVLLVRFSNAIGIGIIFFGRLCHITLIAGINFFYTRYLLDVLHAQTVRIFNVMVTGSFHVLWG